MPLRDRRARIGNGLDGPRTPTQPTPPARPSGKTLPRTAAPPIATSVARAPPDVQPQANTAGPKAVTPGPAQRVQSRPVPPRRPLAPARSDVPPLIASDRDDDAFRVPREALPASAPLPVAPLPRSTVSAAGDPEDVVSKERARQEEAARLEVARLAAAARTETSRREEREALKAAEEERSAGAGARKDRS